MVKRAEQKQVAMRLSHTGGTDHQADATRVYTRDRCLMHWRLLRRDGSLRAKVTIVTKSKALGGGPRRV